MVGDFANKIFFSDESGFILGGYVNKQNCCFLDPEKHQVIEERHYIQKKSLLCALFSPKMWLAEIPPNMYQKVVEMRLSAPPRIVMQTHPHDMQAYHYTWVAIRSLTFGQDFLLVRGGRLSKVCFLQCVATMFCFTWVSVRMDSILHTGWNTMRLPTPANVTDCCT